MSSLNGLTESDLEDLVAAEPEEFLGEPGLKLVARRHQIGPYTFDLLFEDQNGAKLIAETRLGSLERYGVNKVCDYYAEYKEGHPGDFIGVMVVANRIPRRYRRRLTASGAGWCEIHVERLVEFVLKRALGATGEGAGQSTDTPSCAPSEAGSSGTRAGGGDAPKLVEGPCASCGLPAETGHYVALCASCRSQLASRPFPPWIKAAACVTMVALVVALARFPATLSGAAAYERGRQAESRRAFDTAVAEYTRAASRFPGSTLVMARLGIAAFHAGQFEVAARAFQNLGGRQGSPEVVREANEAITEMNKRFPQGR